MPAITTHRLFAEESVELLPQGLVASGDERTAFIIGNQGPDPFFYRFRTSNFQDCMKLGHLMHGSRMTAQFEALRQGVEHLPAQEAGIGRAFVLGLLSHYALDRTAHPFIYEQQWGIQDADPELADAGSQVHAVIESDLDVLMLQLKRESATMADWPPAEQIPTTDHVNRVAGALMSSMARSVYGLTIDVSEYGGAVADMQFVYKLIEPAGSPLNRLACFIDQTFVEEYSLLDGLSHRVTHEVPARTGNLGHLSWEDPFTGAVSTESFPEVFDRALSVYARLAELFIETDDMAAVTEHVNYSGRPLDASEENEEDE